MVSQYYAIADWQNILFIHFQRSLSLTNKTFSRFAHLTYPKNSLPLSLSIFVSLLTYAHVTLYAQSLSPFLRSCRLVQKGENHFPIVCFDFCAGAFMIQIEKLRENRLFPSMKSSYPPFVFDAVISSLICCNRSEKSIERTTPFSVNLKISKEPKRKIT